MQSTNIPSKIPLPFANAASSTYKYNIPTASQIGITNGKASLADGFPPLTFTPIGSGGVPPFGGDMNGILNEITAIQQWQEAGGFFFYDSAFSTTIGGYPKGAVLQSSSFNGLWVSTVENNTTNPDTGGAGWISLAFEGLQSVAVVSNTATLTQLQSAYPIITITGTLTANGTVNVPAQVGEWIFSNQTTGAFTLTVKTSSGTGVTIAPNSSQYCWSDGTNIYYANASSVTSFNTRTGAITLNATDVTTALGYTPYNATNPAGYLSVGLGIGQTWTDVTSSRALSTTYTNSTGKPILVSIFCVFSNGSSATLSVGGVDAGYANAFSGGANNIQAVVPNGVTYSISGPYASLGHWAELR
jgi:hypothetical protein